MGRPLNALAPGASPLGDVPYALSDLVRAATDLRTAGCGADKPLAPTGRAHFEPAALSSTRAAGWRAPPIRIPKLQRWNLRRKCYSIRMIHWERGVDSLPITVASSGSSLCFSIRFCTVAVTDGARQRDTPMQQNDAAFQRQLYLRLTIMQAPGLRTGMNLGHAVYVFRRCPDPGPGRTEKHPAGDLSSHSYDGKCWRWSARMPGSRLVGAHRVGTFRHTPMHVPLAVHGSHLACTLSLSCYCWASTCLTLLLRPSL